MTRKFPFCHRFQSFFHYCSKDCLQNVGMALLRRDSQTPSFWKIFNVQELLGFLVSMLGQKGSLKNIFRPKWWFWIQQIQKDPKHAPNKSNTHIQVSIILQHQNMKKIHQQTTSQQTKSPSNNKNTPKNLVLWGILFWYVVDFQPEIRDPLTQLS